MSTEVQSVIFDKNKYNVTKAKKWLRDNDFISPKVDKTDKYLRFRQKEPSYFDESSFRTIPFGKGTGIKAIIGIPITKNPFDEALDPDGGGHRIGAYAMLFQKHRANAKAIELAGGKGSVEHALEVSKAHEYWNLYQDARESYDPIAKREKRMFNELTLHQKYNDFNSAMNYKLRNNPMKTRKNPVIDGKTIVDNLQGLRKQIRKSYASTKKLGSEQMKYDIVSILLALKKLDSLGRPAQYKVFSGEEKGKPYVAVIYDSGMGCVLFLITKDGKGKPKGTIKYLGYDEDDYELSVGVKIDSLLEHFGDIVDQTMDAPFFDFDLEEEVQEAPHNFIDLLSEYVVEDKDLKKAEYEVKPYKKNPMRRNILSIAKKPTKEKPAGTHFSKMNPHCHCAGDKKNPHCPTHGNKKNPRKGRDEKLVGKVYEAFLNKNVVPYTMIDTFIDKVAGRIVSAGERSDILDLLLDMEVISICCEDDCDFGGSYRLTNENNRGLWYCDTGVKRNPLGTAYRQGVMSGLAYRFNPTKKIMSFESFMDNLADGNVFVGRYVIFVQDGVPMRLEIGSSTPKEVSPEVAFYADLAGQAELVGTSDIDAFSDDYRGLIRQASDASSGGFVSGGGVPVVDVVDVVETVVTDPAVAKLAELEAVFENAQYIASRQELDYASSSLKYLLRETLKVGKRHEKEVISRLQEMAESKRAKKAETLTAKIIALFKKKAEKALGAKIDLIDDKTGKKTTPEKEAIQIIEEIKADPNYRPLFDMQQGFVEGSVIQTPFVFKAPFDTTQDQSQVSGIMDFIKGISSKIEKEAEKGAEFKAQFKNNPRGSHYAYRMSTLDHDHRIDRTRLNNVYIKKNPEMNKGDEFRFPQTTVLNVPIDFDIYQWLSQALPDWESITQDLVSLKEEVSGLSSNMSAQILPALDSIIDSVVSLSASDEEFMVRMQTEIVPAVEAKVKKQLASGKTLKDILGSSKKNPKRTRRNTKRRRRYY